MTIGLRGQFQQLGNIKKLAFLWGGALLVLLVAIVVYQQVKVSSYARLLPLGVTVDLHYEHTHQATNSVVLEYDYGYGFTAAHRQQREISSSSSKQSIHFSISSWKTLKRLRLSAGSLHDLQVKSVTFDRNGDLARVLVSTGGSNQLLLIDDAAELFSARLRGEG